MDTKTVPLSLVVGIVGIYSDLDDRRVAGHVAKLQKKFPGLTLHFQYFDLEDGCPPRTSDEPNAKRCDIEVWVGRHDPRLTHESPQSSLFVYHWGNGKPDSAKDLDELFEFVARGIWIKLNPEEFIKEVLEVLGNDKLRELHCKQYIPPHLVVLNELGGSPPPKCPLCGHDTARAGAIYRCARCGEEVH